MHSKILSHPHHTHKIHFKRQMWWHKSVVPTTLEAEAGESLESRSSKPV
jgi:hypothetical protein